MYSASQNLRNELDKKINEQKEKYGFSINKKDFRSIEFENGWPLIVKDVVYQLTGQDLESTIIREADELPSNSFVPPNGWFEDSELNVYRVAPAPAPPSRHYTYLLHTFRCLQGHEERFEDLRQLDEWAQQLPGNI